MAERDAPLSPDAPSVFCQPDYNGRIRAEHFLLRFADQDVGDVYFEDELEAYDFYDKATVSYNCYLYRLAERRPDARVRQLQRDHEDRALSEVIKAINIEREACARIHDDQAEKYLKASSDSDSNAEIFSMLAAKHRDYAEAIRSRPPARFRWSS